MSTLPELVTAAKQVLYQLHRGDTRQIKLCETQLAAIYSNLNTQNAIPFAQALLHPPPENPPSTDAETMYAFQVLNESILPNFETLPDPFRALVRDTAIRFLAKPTTCSVYMPKAVSFFVSLVLREWPQRYPSFVDDIISMPPSIACHIFSNLSEEIHSFHSSIDPERLTELRNAMVHTLSETLPFVMSAADNFHTCNRWPDLLMALKCIGSFLTWAPLHVLFSNRLPQVCITLLSNPQQSIRNEVLNAMEQFVGRSFPPGALIHENQVHPAAAFRQVFFSLLQAIAQIPAALIPLSRSLLPPTDAFPPLKQAWLASKPIEHVDELAQEFTIKLFEVLSKLGATHFGNSFLIDPTPTFTLSESDREIADAFIDLMIAALTSPSLLLQNSVLSFFTTSIAYVIKKTFISNPCVNLLTRFMHAGGLAILEFPFDPDADCYKLVDYAGDELTDCVDRNRLYSRVLNSLQTAAKVLPNIGPVLATSRMIRILAARPPVDESRPATASRDIKFVQLEGDGSTWNFGDFQGDFKTWLICVEYFCDIAELFSSSANENLSPEIVSKLIESQREAFKIVSSWTEKPMLTVKAHVLRDFSIMYTSEHAALDAAVEMYGKLIDNEETTQTVRFEACSALHTIYRRLGRVSEAGIGRFANTWSQYAAKAINNPGFCVPEKVLLIEAGVFCALSIPDINTSRELIERMLMPLVEIISSPDAMSVFQSPNALFDFLSRKDFKDVEPTISAVFLLDSITHQISRRTTKGAVAIPLPGVLSANIAPKSVEVCCLLLTTLHSFYNTSKFPYNSINDERGSLLLPTCKEIARFVNLDGPDVFQVIETERPWHDMRPDGELGKHPTNCEKNSIAVLHNFGIEPPDPSFAWIRETVRDLRCSCYELFRAAIISGVTSSPVHLKAILSSICSEMQDMEPLHVVAIVSRVLGVLFSYPVICSGASFLQQVSESQVPKLICHMKDQIEANSRGKREFSKARCVDISREHSIIGLRKVGMNMISKMYPRDIAGVCEGFEGFFPLSLKVANLGEQLVCLWAAICDVHPESDSTEWAAAREAFRTMLKAADLAPISEFWLFGRLLGACLKSSVLNLGCGNWVTNGAIGAMLLIVKKWPSEGEAALRMSVGSNESISERMSAVIQTINSGDHCMKAKKQRQLLHGLVEQIATHEGIFEKVKRKIKKLPEKFVLVDPKREARRRARDNNDGVLNDGALDSLFGGGEPL